MFLKNINSSKTLGSIGAKSDIGFERDMLLRITFSTIISIIFWHFLIFYPIFFSQKVKQSTIITNKYDIYELPHELLNDLRLRTLGN